MKRVTFALCLLLVAVWLVPCKDTEDRFTLRRWGFACMYQAVPSGEVFTEWKWK